MPSTHKHNTALALASLGALEFNEFHDLRLSRRKELFGKTLVDL